MEPGALAPKIKRPGCEIDHSPQLIAEGKNGGAIPRRKLCLSLSDLDKISEIPVKIVGIVPLHGSGSSQVCSGQLGVLLAV
jgi:hypothetical protein